MDGNSLMKRDKEMDRKNKSESPSQFSHTICSVCPVITSHHPFYLDFPDKKSRVPSHSFGAQYIEQAGGYNAATQSKDWKAYLLQ